MRYCDPVMATGWHMVLGGAGLLALSLAADGPELADRLSGFGAADAAAMAYGSLLGGAAAYGIFFYNATRGSLTALSSLTFLTPMFAAVSGRRGQAGSGRVQRQGAEEGDLYCCGSPAARSDLCFPGSLPQSPCGRSCPQPVPPRLSHLPPAARVFAHPGRGVPGAG